MNEELNIWELRKVLSNYEDGEFQYIVPDYQKINYGQPVLSLQKEGDGNIYAFVSTDQGECICLCRIKSKEHLIKLKENFSY